MNKRDLESSIFLTGPSCVGKSFLSKELGKRLNMPVISLDDLVLYTEYDMSGDLSRSKKVQGKFIDECFKDIKKDNKLSRNLKDKKLEKKQIQLVLDYVDVYNNYLKLLKSLKPFYKLVKILVEIRENCTEEIQYLVAYSAIATLITEKIIDIVDEPIIIDTPAMFGWKLNYNLVVNKYQNFLKVRKIDIKLSEILKKQEKMFKNSQVVLLEPGQDYSLRNAVKDWHGNKILLKNMHDYYDFAKISITTNAMFNQPNNKYFQQRTCFDAMEYEVKEKLKNKGNISNICDEIISMINDLQQTIKV